MHEMLHIQKNSAIPIYHCLGISPTSIVVYGRLVPRAIQWNQFEINHRILFENMRFKVISDSVA